MLAFFSVILTFLQIVALLILGVIIFGLLMVLLYITFPSFRSALLKLQLFFWSEEVQADGKHLESEDVVLCSMDDVELTLRCLSPVTYDSVYDQLADEYNTKFNGMEKFK